MTTSLQTLSVAPVQDPVDPAQRRRGWQLWCGAGLFKLLQQVAEGYPSAVIGPT
ncbi:hypothetical protein [Streptomyces sp. NPDC005859]|uniref:hypothetical protein n=1 Tax=Streptomyces sp. NPDC005859 TaxID=3157170 RepID=UPI0033F220DD